jgi:hypothetical protein
LAERRGCQPAMSSGTVALLPNTVAVARGINPVTLALLYHVEGLQLPAEGRVPASTLPGVYRARTIEIEHVVECSVFSIVLAVRITRQRVAVPPQELSVMLLQVMLVACAGYATKMKLLCQDVAYVLPIL